MQRFILRIRFNVRHLCENVIETENLFFMIVIYHYNIFVRYGRFWLALKTNSLFTDENF